MKIKNFRNFFEHLALICCCLFYLEVFFNFLPYYLSGIGLPANNSNKFDFIFIISIVSFSICFGVIFHNLKFKNFKPNPILEFNCSITVLNLFFFFSTLLIYFLINFYQTCDLILSFYLMPSSSNLKVNCSEVPMYISQHIFAVYFLGYIAFSRYFKLLGPIVFFSFIIFAGLKFADFKDVAQSVRKNSIYQRQWNKNIPKDYKINIKVKNETEDEPDLWWVTNTCNYSWSSIENKAVFDESCNKKYLGTNFIGIDDLFRLIRASLASGSCTGGLSAWCNIIEDVTYNKELGYPTQIVLTAPERDSIGWNWYWRKTRRTIDVTVNRL